MAQKNLLAKDDFTENERAYIANFHALGASIPPREITIFRPPIKTREDLLKTILWRINQVYYNTANNANFTNEKFVLHGKRPDFYDDSSFPFFTLNDEKEFSDKVTSFINEYLPSLQNNLSVGDATTNTNDIFLRHYEASIHLLLQGPPHANEHGIDRDLAEQWIAAHKTPERQRLARLLVENTIYISHKELLSQIQKCIAQIQTKLVPGLPIIFLTGPKDKSNYYISLLFYHFWTQAGLPVNTIKVYLDEIVRGNIIDIDEMAYSGTQTTGTLANVYQGLTEKMISNLVKVNCTKRGIDSFCKSKSFFPLALFEKILHEKNVNYILVRIFCSENGEKELLRIPHGNYRNPLKLPSHLVIGRRLQSPETLFGKANATKLSILYGTVPGQPASTAYFNHKVANLPSTFLFPYAYGVVPNKPLFTENNYWVSNANKKKEFQNAIKNLETATNTDAVEFMPFIRYCAPGTRLLPRNRKNLLNYEPPTKQAYSEKGPELPQEYRCPYAWYKRINYDTGTYDPLPLPNLPPLPYGPTENNFMGGKRTRRQTRKTQTRKHRK